MTMTTNDLDALILSTSKTQWRKVAMIIGMVDSACQRNGESVSDDVIADRIRILVEEGKLDAQGDLSLWRYSEVKLPE